MPDWLPALATVDPWTETTYGMLYSIFCHDIRDNHLLFRGNNVWIYQEKEDGKEKIFWHLTTREDKRQSIPRRKEKLYPPPQVTPQPQPPERLPDLRRCERLLWVKPLIEHPSDPHVLAWDYEEGDRTIKTYVWLRGYNFVVIMKKYPNGKRRLITSFYVDEEYKEKDFGRKYENRIK